MTEQSQPAKRKERKRLPGRSTRRQMVFLKRSFGLLGRFALFLLLLPIRALLLSWTLGSRFFLLFATLILLVYFIATTVVTGPFVLGILNDVLLGTFSADHVDVNLVAARVQLFNVRITHPMGHDIVHARRVSTGIDAAGLAFWGIKSAIGVSGPMPLLLRETRVDGYDVLLPFDDDGFHFTEAFLPAMLTPDEGPSGPGPIVTLSHVVLGEGRVLLDFDSWTMPIEVQRLNADMRIGGPEEFVLTASSLQVSDFRIVGLIPDPVDWVTEVGSAVTISRFRMNLDEMEAHDATIVHPDFEAVVRDFAFQFARDDMPVTCGGEVTLLAPERLAQVSLGHVFGSAIVDFDMFGSISLPEFKFRMRSPLLIAEELPFEDVSAQAGLDLSGGVFINVTNFNADLMGSLVELAQTTFEMEYGGDPDIGVEGCFEGLRPGLIANALELEGFLDYVDLLASGCCHKCRLHVGSDGVRIDGGLAIAVNTGAAGLALSGVEAGVLEAFVSWTGDAARWEGLSVTTDIGHVSSVGFLTLLPELRGRIDAAIYMDDLADIPLLGVLGIAGAVEIPEIVLAGSIPDPTLKLTAAASDLRVAGEIFTGLNLEAGYEGGRAVLDFLCFQHEMSGGCFSGNAAIPLDGSPLFPLPVSLTVADPMAIDLGNLPYLKVPATGGLAVGPLDVQGAVHEDWLETLASFEGALRVEGTNLASPLLDLKVRSVRVELDKAMAPAGPPDPGSAKIDLALEWLEVGDLKVKQGSLTLDMETVVGLDGDYELFPLPIGKGRLHLTDLQYGDERLPAASFDLQGRRDPLIASAKGRVELGKQASIQLSSEVLLDKLVASARIATQRFPLSVLPGSLLPEATRGMLAQTRVTLDLQARKIALASLLEGNYKGTFDRLLADGKITVENLAELPEPVLEAAATFSLRKGRFALEPLTITFLGDREATYRGSIWPLAGRLAGTLRIPRTRLSNLRTYRALDIPVDAVVSLEVDLDGPFLTPTMAATIGIRELVAADIELGDATLKVAGRYGDKLTITAPEFIKGLDLDEAIVRFDRGVPQRLDATVSFKHLTPRQILPDFPDVISASASGTASTIIRFGAGEAFEMAIDLPEKSLQACLRSSALEFCMENPAPSQVVLDTAGIRFKDTRMLGGGHTLDLQGGLDYSTGWDLLVSASLDVARMPFLGDALASYEGLLGTGKDPLHISGALDSPEIRGSIRLGQLQLLPRQLGSEITIPSGVFQISGNLVEGRMVGLIEEDVPLSGTYDEGTFSVYGWFRLRDWSPDDALLFLTGKEIFYQSPGQFRLVINPSVEFAARGLASLDGGKSKLSGEVYLSEGEFTRNFDRLIGSFATAFSRTQERYSKPITEVVPFLANMALDLRVRGGNFAVSSRFPFGETELTVNLDLGVGGTLSDLKLYDWMRLVPGGTITYKVVKRVFAITQGTVDFSGDPSVPYIDIEAITDVPYKRSSDTGVALELDEEAWGENVPIKIRLTGTYPNLTPEFSSDKPGFDDADLQTLLLLGMTRKDLEGRSDDSGGRADVSINLLTEDVAGMVSNLLLAPFVDTVSLGFTTTGGIMAEAATKIGRAISLSTRVRKDSDEEEYTAGIRFKITDRLSLEGRMKKAEDQFDAQTLYEAKFKYVIPLD